MGRPLPAPCRLWAHLIDYVLKRQNRGKLENAKEQKKNSDLTIETIRSGLLFHLIRPEKPMLGRNIFH